jgi:hypothetical protein
LRTRRNNHYTVVSIIKYLNPPSITILGVMMSKDDKKKFSVPSETQRLRTLGSLVGGWARDRAKPSEEAEQEPSEPEYHGEPVTMVNKALQGGAQQEEDAIPEPQEPEPMIPDAPAETESAFDELEQAPETATREFWMGKEGAQEGESMARVLRMQVDGANQEIEPVSPREIEAPLEERIKGDEERRETLIQHPVHIGGSVAAADYQEDDDPTTVPGYTPPSKRKHVIPMNVPKDKDTLMPPPLKMQDPTTQGSDKKQKYVLPQKPSMARLDGEEKAVWLNRIEGLTATYAMECSKINAEAKATGGYVVSYEFEHMNDDKAEE